MCVVTAAASPKPYTTRPVPAKLGAGEVRLYDAHKAGLPDLVKPPPEKLLAEYQWWLVHFPSRRWAAVKGDRLEGLRVLKKLEKGVDEVGVLPPVKVKKPRQQADKETKGLKKPPAPARAHTRAGGREAGEEAGGEEKADQPKFTQVPPDLNFDAAMKHVFPNQRITAKLEALMEAERPVYDKEGVLVGHVPDYMTQISALKLGIEHAQGRAGEKPPPPPDKKRVSYEELEGMLRNNAAARLVFKNLLAEIEKPAAPPPAPAVES